MEMFLPELWATMGMTARGVIVVLVTMSIASLAIAAERGWVLRRMRRDSKTFLEEWRQVTGGRGYGAGAEVAAEYPRSPAAAAVTAATAAMLRARTEAAGLAASTHAIRRVGLETATEAKRGMALLATVGSTAPFVGLFGTVVGIVNAFRSMAASGQGGLTSVSAGIAEALVTTALGILVAIPAVWIFNSLTQAIGRLLAEVEAAGEELAEIALAPASDTRAERRAGGSHGGAA